jgi:hypothetical protein
MARQPTQEDPETINVPQSGRPVPRGRPVDPVFIAPNVALDVHTLLVASFFTWIGMQCVSFAIIARRYAAIRGLLPVSPVVRRILFPITLERVLVTALIIGIAGLGGIVWCVMQWADAGFGPLQYGALIRVLTVSITAVALAL